MKYSHANGTVFISDPGQVWPGTPGKVAGAGGNGVGLQNRTRPRTFDNAPRNARTLLETLPSFHQMTRDQVRTSTSAPTCLVRVRKQNENINIDANANVTQAHTHTRNTHIAKSTQVQTHSR